jgi:hypothetical protein
VNGHVERRVSKTKGTRYRVLVFVDAEHGGPRWQTCGTYDREGAASAKLVKVLDAYHGGTYRRPSRLTVAAIVDAWLTQHVAQLRPLTRQNYGGICANFIVPELGAELAESVTPADVSACSGFRRLYRPFPVSLPASVPARHGLCAATRNQSDLKSRRKSS